MHVLRPPGPAFLGVPGELPDRDTNPPVGVKREDVTTAGRTIRPLTFGLLLLLPLITAGGFVLYTHEVWEDFFITFRHTENLVRGFGLVYQPGERVHGFTSVLNTLIPAVPLLIFGTLDASLLVYRLCSLAALLLGLWVLWRNLAGRLQAGWGELLFGAILVATSTKIIVFTMNGQEAGFLVGFLALALGTALRFDEPGAWRMMGLGWAGLLYTRPDSPLYIALVAVIAWSVYRGGTRAFFTDTARAGGLAAVCFAPWFIFAWMYYGSPVPHTVIAKAADSLLVNNSSLGTFFTVCAQFVEITGETFGPIYGLAGWPSPLAWGAVLGGLACVFFFILPVRDRFTRSCSLALGVILFYQCFLRVQREAFPWYFGPASLLAIVVAGRGAAALWARPTRWGKPAALMGGGLLVATSVGIFALSHVHMKIQQAEVEDNTRKAIGLWLAEHAAPGDSVYLEPIGYIGYYSRLKILDFPGLVSPAVVKARREHKAGYGALPAILKPTWIVARASELGSLQAVPAVVSAYESVKAFDHRPALEKYGRFAGERTVRHDAVYVILRRKPGAP